MTPREELEVRLTALLLGELPADEAAALRNAITKDPELARLHGSLQRTIGLVREAGTAREQEVSAGAEAEAPKLSAERREKLLATFKTVRPPQLQRSKRQLVPQRELFALAAMAVALLAVGALVLGRFGSLKGKIELASMMGRRESTAESKWSEEFESLSEDKMVRELRPAKRPPAVATDPAAGLPSVQEADNLEMAALYSVAVDAAKSVKQLADLPSPSLPAGETPVLSFGGQTPPPAAQPPSVTDGFRSIPSRNLRIALPVMDDNVLASVELKSQVAQTAVDGRGATPAGELDKSLWFGQSTATTTSGGTGVGGGGRGRTPAPSTPGVSDAQASWRYAGGEYAGVNVSGAAPAAPGLAPMVPAQKPAQQLGLNFKADGLAVKDFDVDGSAAYAVVVTNSVVSNPTFNESQFVETTPHAGQGFVSGGVGGFAFGGNAQSNSGRVSGRDGASAIDALGDSSAPSRARDLGAATDRFYSFSDLAPKDAVMELKRESELKERSVKLAEDSKDKKSGAVAVNGALGFEVRTGRPVSGPQPEAGQKAAETPRPEIADAFSKNHVQIALPEGKSAEVREKLQIASGPVSASEPSPMANRPAPARGDDLALAVDESRRSLGRQPVAIDEVKLKQVPAEHDQPTGVVDREANLVQDVAKLEKKNLEQRELLERRKKQSESDPNDPVSGASRAEALRQKLESIRLPEVRFDSLPLSQVIEEIAKEARKQDAANRGVNLLVTSEKNRKLKPNPDIEPSTGLPIQQDNSESIDAGQATITISSPLRNVTLGEALAAIAKASDRPINLSLANYGVVLSVEDKKSSIQSGDNNAPRRPAPTAPIPQPEVFTADNAFSTFSLNVSDVSFKLAAASLEKGQMPDPATVRSEEFINAFDYRDPEPKGSAPIAFAWERARYPFAHGRDLVRLSVKTAASGRQPGRPLNLVLLLDNSGSMERADRLRIRQECLRVLAGQLQPEDRVSVVAFARTARLWVDGLPGAQAGELAQRVGSLTPEGGTNLEDAMNLAYQTALRHFQANGVNRVVLLTDGAANLGDVEPESLKKKVEGNRRQGVALDCFGLGWDGYNDDLLEVLSRNGDGRYGFINTPEAAASDFAGQLAGALKVAASDVKVQVEWNPRRVTAYRQIGYAKHQLKKEQFRDNTVDAAEIGAAEAGNALYVVQVNSRGEGPLGTMRVRFKVPGTADYREHEWPLAYDGAAKSLDNSSQALRLAASASAFSEWLVSSPYAAEVTPDRLLGYLSGVPESAPADPRPKKLEWMIRQAKSLSGK